MVTNRELGYFKRILKEIEVSIVSHFSCTSRGANTLLLRLLRIANGSVLALVPLFASVASVFHIRMSLSTLSILSVAAVFHIRLSGNTVGSVFCWCPGIMTAEHTVASCCPFNPLP